MMKKTTLILMITLLILLAFVTTVLGQSGYLLSRSVIAGGGGRLQSGSYSLTGTSGQPEAGQALANGNYSLWGGFWHSSNQVILFPQKIFLPVITR
jgi:hypothetical protein